MLLLVVLLELLLLELLLLVSAVHVSQASWRARSRRKLERCSSDVGSERRLSRRLWLLAVRVIGQVWRDGRAAVHSQPGSSASCVVRGRPFWLRVELQRDHHTGPPLLLQRRHSVRHARPGGPALAGKLAVEVLGLCSGLHVVFHGLGQDILDLRREPLLQPLGRLRLRASLAEKSVCGGLL